MPATSTGEQPSVVYDSPGTYEVTLTVSNSAGQDQVVQTDYIIVGDVPAPSFTANANGLVVGFTNTSINTDNSGGMTFEWDFGDGNTSTQTDPSHTYNEDGVYVITLTATNDCGSMVINDQVVIVTEPTAGFSANQAVGCMPITVQFTNESTSNAETFMWEFPGGTPSTSTDENPTVV